MSSKSTMNINRFIPRKLEIVSSGRFAAVGRKGNFDLGSSFGKVRYLCMSNSACDKLEASYTHYKTCLRSQL